MGDVRPTISTSQSLPDVFTPRSQVLVANEERHTTSPTAWYSLHERLDWIDATMSGCVPTICTQLVVCVQPSRVCVWICAHEQRSTTSAVRGQSELTKKRFNIYRTYNAGRAHRAVTFSSRFSHTSRGWNVFLRRTIFHLILPHQPVHSPYPRSYFSFSFPVARSRVLPLPLSLLRFAGRTIRPRSVLLTFHPSCHVNFHTSCHMIQTNHIQEHSTMISLSLSLASLFHSVSLFLSSLSPFFPLSLFVSFSRFTLSLSLFLSLSLSLTLFLLSLSLSASSSFSSLVPFLPALLPFYPSRQFHSTLLHPRCHLAASRLNTLEHHFLLGSVILDMFSSNPSTHQHTASFLPKLPRSWAWIPLPCGFSCARIRTASVLRVRVVSALHSQLAAQSIIKLAALGKSRQSCRKKNRVTVEQPIEKATGRSEEPSEISTQSL